MSPVITGQMFNRAKIRSALVLLGRLALRIRYRARIVPTIEAFTTRRRGRRALRWHGDLGRETGKRRTNVEVGMRRVVSWK